MIKGTAVDLVDLPDATNRGACPELHASGVSLASDAWGVELTDRSDGEAVLERLNPLAAGSRGCTRATTVGGHDNDPATPRAG